jgi:ribose/xylose/arabinose/galactoside ABC-type transport system permease subunit
VNKAEQKINFERLSLGKRLLSSNSTYLLIGLIIYLIIVSIIAPNFATAYNFSIVTEQLAVPGILAVGMCMVMISGGIDLSVGNQLSFIACVMSYFIFNDASAVGLGITVGVAVCIACSFAMGFLISRTRMEPFIVSLAFMTIYKGLAYIITNGAEYPITGTMGFATSIRLFNLPLMVYIMIAVFVAFGLIIHFTRFGRRLYAVGDNPEAAFMSGINVKNFKLMLYTLNGALVALSTVLMLSRNEVGNPNLGVSLEMTAIASAVVGGTALAGGKGTIVGTLLGVAWVGIVSNSLNIIGVSSFYQYVVTGCIVIGAVFINQLRYKKG